jgi:hypothetical protein
MFHSWWNWRNRWWWKWKWACRWYSAMELQIQVVVVEVLPSGVSVSGAGGSGVVILRMPDRKLFRNNNRFSNSNNWCWWHRYSFNIYRIRKLHRIIYGIICKNRFKQ